MSDTMVRIQVLDGILIKLLLKIQRMVDNSLSCAQGIHSYNKSYRFLINSTKKGIQHHAYAPWERQYSLSHFLTHESESPVRLNPLFLTALFKILFQIKDNVNLQETKLFVLRDIWDRSQSKRRNFMASWMISTEKFPIFL